MYTSTGKAKPSLLAASGRARKAQKRRRALNTMKLGLHIQLDFRSTPLSLFRCDLWNGRSQVREALCARVQAEQNLQRPAPLKLTD